MSPMDLPLGVLLDRGFGGVTLSCGCGHKATLELAGLIAALRPTLRLSELRARCTRCGGSEVTATPWRAAPDWRPSPEEAYEARRALLDAILPSKSRRRI